MLDNIYVAKMPSHKKASMRRTEFAVDGRDGILHRNQGFSNFDLEATLIILNGETEDSPRQLINAWADGTGKLITSDDPNRCYRASVLEEVRFDRAVFGGKICDTAKITFNCEPYMYEAIDSKYEFTQSGVIVNIGSAEALPLIYVYGSGTCSFSISGQSITLNGVTEGVAVTIDSETGYIYSALGAQSMEGEIPVIPLTTAQQPVVLGAGVTKLEIYPRWRWV